MTLYCLKGSKFFCKNCNCHLFNAAINIYHGDYINEKLFASVNFQAKNGTPMNCPDCKLRFRLDGSGLNIKVANLDNEIRSES